HRHHAALRRVRWLVAGDELDARRASHTRERPDRAGERHTVTRSIAANIRGLTLTIALTFLVTSLGVGYWTLVSGDELGSDPFNPRLVAAIRDRPRGVITDGANNELAKSVQTPSGYKRVYADKTLAHVTGYASFQFGASGIEAAYAESLI